MLFGYSYFEMLDKFDIIWSEEMIDWLFLDGLDYYILGLKMLM